MKNLIYVFLLALISISYSQNLDFLPKGLGLELGIGYNQMKNQEIPVEPFFSSESFTRNEFKITPTIRISLEKEVLTNFSLTPFISYSITGGKSEKMENGYEDEFLFRTLDFGLFAQYNFRFISFSIGSKYNRYLEITSKAYGSVVDPISAHREWNESDMSFAFKKWSYDLGGRTSYNISNFTIALEGWYSITELAAKDIEKYVAINSNRYQILVGYKF